LSRARPAIGRINHALPGASSLTSRPSRVLIR
jgi:hypothetical protein